MLEYEDNLWVGMKKCQGPCPAGRPLVGKERLHPRAYTRGPRLKR